MFAIYHQGKYYRAFERDFKAKYYHTCSVLKYFVVGGRHSDYVRSNVVFQLSESGKNWTNTTMKYARYLHGATTVPKESQDHCKVLKV